MIRQSLAGRRVYGTGYLPSVDGWRALAVLGVMMAHDRAWNLFGYSSSHYKDIGGNGVYVFFAISGFLITSRILEEERICGYFDIRRFYIRRIFRIQPAAMVFLGAVAVLMAMGLAHQFGVRETSHTWVAALFLFTNYIYHPGGADTLTGHFWTLAVEEHFYILLSLTLLLVRKWRAVAVGVLFLSFFLLPHLAGAAMASTPRATQWQLGALLLASLAAVLLRNASVERIAVGVLQPWAVFVATPLLMLANENVGRLRTHASLIGICGFQEQIPFAVFHLAIFWLIATVYHPGSLTTRLLETRGFRFVGKISYSLYLWHVLVNYLWNFLGSTGLGPIAHIQNHWLKSLAERPARYAMAFAVSWLCFRYVEKPMIRLGHRLAPPATPGRPEFAELPVQSAVPGFTPLAASGVDPVPHG